MVDELASRQMLTYQLDPCLGTFVSSCLGFTSTAQPGTTRILPHIGVPLVFQFDPAPGVFSVDGKRSRLPELPTMGLHDRAMTLPRPCSVHGVTVNLTPPGAYALFGIALREISNTITGMPDLLGNRAAILAEQLAETRGWRDRFELVNLTLARWFAADRRRPAPAVVHAWQRLCDTHGQIRIHDLARDLGVSTSYLTKRFGEQIGLSPKAFCKTLRFRHALRLSVSSTAGFGSIAEACGYSDQSHLNRDFRQLADCTPTEYRERHAPEFHWQLDA
jgi:AraC-like DNA-binding protein